MGQVERPLILVTALTDIFCYDAVDSSNVTGKSLGNLGPGTDWSIKTGQASISHHDHLVPCPIGKLSIQFSLSRNDFLCSHCSRFRRRDLVQNVYELLHQASKTFKTDNGNQLNLIHHYSTIQFTKILTLWRPFPAADKKAHRHTRRTCPTFYGLSPGPKKARIIFVWPSSASMSLPQNCRFQNVEARNSL